MIKNIDKLSPNDALIVLKKLWDNYPELKKDILIEAEKILSDIDKNEIAEDVFWVLNNIDVHELWDRSGSSRDGYTSPGDMAVEMIEEELEPFNNEVNKYHNLKMAEQAKQYCMGVLKGIYEFDKESQSEFKDWATDIPPECFGYLLDEWKKKCKRKKDLAEMNEFIKKECPDWAKWAITKK